MTILKVDYTADNAGEMLAKSFRDTGFAVIKNHPIEVALMDRVYDLWQQFFASETKMDYLFDVELQDGLFPLDTAETAKGCDIKDLKEFYHVYPKGRIPDFLKEDTMLLRSQMFRIGKTLLDWLQAATPGKISQQLSMPFSEMLDTNRTLLRIINYPALTGDEEPGAVRAASHEDINLVTVLPSATAEGLEAQDLDGVWHAVPLDPGSLIINCGDMMQECTGGYYRSTSHRVVNPEGEKARQARLSMPMFMHPGADVPLSENYTGESYLNERLVELGLRDTVVA